MKYWRTARISSSCVPTGYLVVHDVGRERGEDTNHDQFTKEVRSTSFEKELGVAGLCIPKSVANARDESQIAGT